MKCPMLVIKVPLYDVDENEQMVPFSKEAAMEVLNSLEYVDGFEGFTIGSISLEEEDVLCYGIVSADQFEWDFSRMDDGVLLITIEDVVLPIDFTHWIYCPGDTSVDYSNDHISISLGFTPTIKQGLLSLVQENKVDGQGKFFWEK